MNAQYEENGKIRKFVIGIEADGKPPDRVQLSTQDCPKGGHKIKELVLDRCVLDEDLAIYRLWRAVAP